MIDGLEWILFFANLILLLVSVVVLGLALKLYTETVKMISIDRRTPPAAKANKPEGEGNPARPRPLVPLDRDERAHRATGEVWHVGRGHQRGG